MPPMDVAVIVGSLRKGSYTRKIGRALSRLAPDGLRCREVQIADLDMYDEDLDAAPPKSWIRFREQIAQANAVLILTPDYNRSIPACLKNALDVGSRPEGQNLWDGKPAGIVSVTPYQMGAMAANHAVRQALVYLNMPAMQQPEAYVAKVREVLDSRGRLTSRKTRHLLTQFMAAFEQWCGRAAGESSGADFAQFIKERERIASAYCRGDPAPLEDIVVPAGTATFFPPHGPTVKGSGAVAKKYHQDAKQFSRRSKSRLTILQAEASGEIGFWAGLQHFEGAIAGKSTKMTLRITEIFRREHSEWKLIHRHAAAQ